MADENMDVSAKRVETLEQRYQHLDDRVSSMAADMSSIRTSVQSLHGNIQAITEALSELTAPRPVNWPGIVGAAIAFMTLIAVSIGAGTKYVSLSLEPLLTEQRRVHQKMEEVDKTISYRGEIIGRVVAQIEQTQEQQKHIDALRHELEGRVSALESRASAAEVSRRAIGDYVRDVDQHGSRKWIGEKPDE